jgi:site-specific DNA recombinase
MSIRGYVAEVERLKLRERVQRGRKGRLQSGKIHSEGFEKYGWRREKVEGKFTGKRFAHEPEANVVRQIFRFYADKEWSMLKIAQYLNAKGIPSPAISVKRNYKNGKIPRWNKKTISNIIVDPDYKGETVVWRTKIVGKGRDKKQVLRDDEEMIRLPEGVSEAIVPVELWEFCQKRRVSNKQTRKRERSTDRLVRGIAYCGHCGFKMASGWSGRKKKPTIQYRCNKKWERPDLNLPKCPGRSASQIIVDGVVWDFVSGIILRPELLKSALEAYEVSGPDQRLIDEIQSCEAAIASVEKGQERLIKSLVTVNDDLVALIQKELSDQESRKKLLREELFSLRRVFSEKAHTQTSLMSIAEFCQRASQNIQDIPFEGRRHLLETLGVKVFINGRDNIEVEMFFDPETNKFVSQPVSTLITRRSEDDSPLSTSIQTSEIAPFNEDLSLQPVDTSQAQDTSSNAGAERCRYVCRTAPVSD